MPALNAALSTQALQSLLQNSTQIWRGAEPARIKVRASGHAMLDAVLPGGGWPVGSLIELLPLQEGIGELSLNLPALQALNDEGRAIVFVRPPHTPYPPALLKAGLSLKNILWILAQRDEDARWAAEQTLHAGAAGAVLLWSNTGDDRCLRRLQLAAEAGQALTFLYRAPGALRKPSPAALRIALHPRDEAVGVEIVKARGGQTALVNVPLHWPAV